jgi:hypothetical protein
LGAALLGVGTEFTLIDNVNVDLPTTGFFEGLPDRAQMQIGLNRFEIDYESGTNANDVILRAIPEPSALLIAAFAVVCFACRRRRGRTAGDKNETEDGDASDQFPSMVMLSACSTSWIRLPIVTVLLPA